MTTTTDFDILGGKTVLITGGTGSFGKNFAKHILEHSTLKKLIIFSRDELKQSMMEKEIGDERLRFFIGDVRDLPRLQRAFHGVDIVVHAAALKQVPTLEYNPFEAVKTNIIGTQNVIEAAIDQGVERVLLVSTDKAAKPTNLYGSTKLCAEKLIVGGNVYSAGNTKFSAVRYGNVVGSRGSIVEHLLKNRGAKTVYITDERMTRFWLGLEDAFRIVLFGLTHMEGGELFVPKAPTMKVSDLFDLVVPGVKREVIGIRPGEKIHEILLTHEESRHSIELDEYYVVIPEFRELASIDRMAKYSVKGKDLPPEFQFTSENAARKLSNKQLMQIIERLEVMLRAQ